MKKEEFLKGVNNWDNHRYLLWDALENTKGCVVEFGCGDGSTPFLHEYCEKKGRELRSYENNIEWLDRYKNFESATHKLFFVKNWDDVELDEISVLLIDHAPGERRKIDLKRYANIAKVIVAHDTEPAADHGYQMRGELAKFKYQVDYQSPGAWASAVSNFVDVKKLHYRV